MKPQTFRTSWRALVFLDGRRGWNRLRRLLHRPFWLLVSAGFGVGLVLLILQVGAAWGMERAAGAPGPGDPGPWLGLVALWVLLSLGTRLWGATTRSPIPVTNADAVLLFPSPVSSRVLVLYHVARKGLHRLVAQVPFWLLWLLLFRRAGVAVHGQGLLAFFLLMLLVGLWGDGLHTVAWLALERAPQGERIRRYLRRGLVGGALLILLGLAWPLVAQWGAGLDGGQAVRLLLARAQPLAQVPPLGWVVALMETAVGTGGWPGAALAGALALVGGLWLAAWHLGEGYYEPLVLQGEADARLAQAVSSGNVDVQGVAVAHLGVTERVARVRALPWGGRGAWALFWQQANRWLRLELGTWRWGLVVFGLVGGLLGFLVRVGLPSGALWLVPCGLAVLSAPWGYLAEELRRPYIYLIPDASWKRLVAASLVTAADLFLSYTVLMVVAMLLAWPGLSRLLAGLLALLAASWLAQGALALSSLLVPAWVGRWVRSLLQSLVALAGLIPGAAAGWLVEVRGGGEVVGLAAGSLVTWLVGGLLMALASAFFQRAEMAE